MKIKPFHHVASLLTVFLFLFLAYACAGDGNTASGNKENSSSQDESEIEILKTKIKDDNVQGNMTISCKIKNNTDKDAEIVSLKSTYFDEDGEEVATGAGNAMDLAAGETTTVDVKATSMVRSEDYEVKVRNVNFK